MKRQQKYILQSIFIISLTATLGSFYIGYRGDPILNRQSWYFFNRLNGIPPCEFCWYMRIFQYPLVFISGIALLTKDKTAIKYIWPMALAGLITAVYKRGMEGGWIAESGMCLSGISCSTPTNLWWVISLPLIGVWAFLLILIASFISLSAKHGK